MKLWRDITLLLISLFCVAATPSTRPNTLPALPPFAVDLSTPEAALKTAATAYMCGRFDVIYDISRADDPWRPLLKEFLGGQYQVSKYDRAMCDRFPTYKSEIPTEEDIRRMFEEDKKAANKMLAPMKVEITSDTARFVGDKWPVMQHVGNEWRMQLGPWMKGSEKAFKENIARFKIYGEVAEEVRAGKYQSVRKVQGEIVNRMVAYEFATRNTTTQPATSP